MIKKATTNNEQPINQRIEDDCVLLVFIENGMLDKFAPLITIDRKEDEFYFEMPPMDKNDSKEFSSLQLRKDAPAWVKKCSRLPELSRKVMEIATIYRDLKDRGVFEDFYKKYQTAQKKRFL